MPRFMISSMVPAVNMDSSMLVTLKWYESVAVPVFLICSANCTVSPGSPSFLFPGEVLVSSKEYIGLIVVEVMNDSVTEGVLSAVAGGITSVVTKLIYSRYDAESKAEDEIRKTLEALNGIEKAVDLTNSISNPETRDEVLTDIVRKLAGI